MAKQVKLQSETEINGVTYAGGTILSVCDELFVILGLPEYKGSHKKPNPSTSE